MRELSEAELDALINEATVDCYSEDEQVTGFAVMIGDNLAVPFETTVLGVTVTVEEVCQTGSGIVATCVRGKHRQAIPILDLPLPDPPPRGAEWIAAHGRWAELGDGGMSEYQYYEFLALDRSLTDKQRAELRSLSTRAEISATRFVNEYHWGNFRGDPQKMMERYFDAFLYLANWGTRHLMFRLPREVLDAETADLYCYTDAASLLETKDHLIVSLYADRDPDDYWEEAAGRLAAMVQARSDLAAGDLRLLYLGWLLAVQSDDVDDADTEPPVPAGLGELSAPLRAVADFLDVDQDLLAVAAEASPDARAEDHGGLAEWIACLQAKEKDALLARVVSGEGAAVQALLSRRFRRACGGNEPAAATRTAAELWKAAGDRKAAREKAEEERRHGQLAREAAAKAAAYARRLDELATRQEAAWEQAGVLIETKNPHNYDIAVTLLSDLRALAERRGETAAFTSRFLALRQQHQRKPSLQERFDRAGLPHLA